MRNKSDEYQQPLEERLFYSIVGYSDIKKLIARCIVSNELVHVLLTGPPATSKTVFLLEMWRELENVHFIDGTNTSGVGMTDYLFSNPKTNYLLIDEIDKLQKNYQTLLYNVMETGILTETKAESKKGSRQQKMHLKIFATSNDLHKLNRPLKSRFLKLELTEYTWEEFYGITYNLIQSRYKLNTEIITKIAEVVWTDIGSKDVRDSLQIAKLTKKIDDIEDIAHTLVKYKPKEKENKSK
jgi:Holliday junction resolvasome RuvABC ATP-dependent DNA helicase subunit